MHIPGNFWFPGIVLVLLSIGFFSPVFPSLTIETKEGKVLYSTPWSKGDRFELSYLHSVNKSPITDLFTVRDGKILLIASRFHSFGAGVAALPEESGGHVRVGREYLEYVGIEREMPALSVFVPREANTTFRYGKEAIPLNRLSPPGTLLRIRLTRQSLAARFFLR
jgi:hypothetical protein